MSYCPDCGNEVGEHHRYCGSCGNNLKPDETPTQMPSYEPWDGFLSPQAYRYLHRSFGENEAVDTDDKGYYYLSQDVAAAVGELGMLAKVDGVNLFEMLSERAESPEVMGREPSKLSDDETHQRLMWLGFFRIPDLYDKSVGTDFGERLTERLQKVIDEVNKEG